MKKHHTTALQQIMLSLENPTLPHSTYLTGVEYMIDSVGYCEEIAALH
jgi:hypothetical protein